MSRRPVVPAYFHPLTRPADWDLLTTAGNTVRAVILNVADGPGPDAEPALRAAAARLDVPVLGYVDTAHGYRRAAAVHRDVTRYRDWYAVDGIFFDQVAGGPGNLAYYAHLASETRHHGCTTVMFQHGHYPDPRYAQLADLLGVFEGPASSYLHLRPPPWARSATGVTFCHLVYETPQRQVPVVLAHAEACGAGSVYVTARGGPRPWDRLSGYLHGRSPVST
ncbi:spherulation-specific family 4 protein [Actinoplanes sp. NBRC 101535]|uniref:spherulation-specific family 4 protein n=1 Tax=Actinoplanes sp. NBRC 101535 TaxID=3032196 RepID=UPI002554C26F|nr:spherulation-specific family 4 protein [Actinoplanes sp. NBRC 101535]